MPARDLDMDMDPVLLAIVAMDEDEFVDVVGRVLHRAPPGAVPC